MYSSYNIQSPAKKNFAVNSSDFSRVGQTTEGLMNQQANVFEEYLRLTFTALETTTYLVQLNYQWTNNIGNTNFLGRTRVLENGLEVYNEFNQEYESKDIGGAGQVVNILTGGAITGNANTGADIKKTVTDFVDLNVISGNTYDILLEWGAESVNSEATIYKANIIAFQL